MMRLLWLIAGAVPGCEPPSSCGCRVLSTWQHLAPCPVGIGTGRWQLPGVPWEQGGTGLGPTTRTGPCFTAGREASREETLLQGRVEER